MPTYNFTSDGDVFIYNYLSRAIDGPAAFTPRDDADYFTMTYLGGSDLYYWPDNTFQIDGETFEGTLEEFCTAAEALYATAEGGGGGAAWSDITANTIVEVASDKSLVIRDDEDNGLISASNGASIKIVGLGDPDGMIFEGPTSSIEVKRNITDSIGHVVLDANYDGYTSDAYVRVRASSATEAEVYMALSTSEFNGSFRIRNEGFGFYGNGPALFFTNGVRLPNLTKTQRDALVSPGIGTAIFQTDDTPGLRVYNGTNWMKYTEATD